MYFRATHDKYKKNLNHQNNLRINVLIIFSKNWIFSDNVM